MSQGSRRMWIAPTLALVALGSVAPARATELAQSPVPLQRMWDLEHDPATGRVFVTGGFDDAGIAVFDEDGALVETIADTGAAAIVIDGGLLYVTLLNSGEIRVYDTATLAPVRTIALGLPNPAGAVLASGRIWLRYGSCGSSPGIASVDLATGTVRTHVIVDGPTYCPFFATVPSDPATLIAADHGISPTTLYRLRISGDTLELAVKRRLSSPTSSSNAADMAISPDGTRVVLAAGSPSRYREFRVHDLAPTGLEYPGGSYPSAVAYTADGGYVATGKRSGIGDDLFAYADGAPAVVLSHDFGTAQGREVTYDAVATDPEGTKIYAVTVDTYGEQPVLHVLSGARTTASASILTLTGPTGGESGDTLVFSGTMTLADGASPEGRSVRLVRVGARTGAVQAATASVAADGTFAFTDVAHRGLNRYHVAWSGTPEHLGALSAQVVATITGPAPTVTTYGGESWAVRFTQIHPRATVIDEDGLPVAGHAVTFEMLSGTTPVLTTSAITDATGLAEAAPVTVTGAPGAYSVRSSFAATTEYLASVDTDAFTIYPPPLGSTSILGLGPASGMRGSPTPFSATLVDQDGAPVGGARLAFSLGGVAIGEATTVADGTAVLSVPPPRAPGTYALTAAFAGGSGLSASSASAPFAVTWELTFVADDGAGRVFLNPATSELAYEVGVWASGVVSDPSMRVVTLVAGERVVLVDRSDLVSSITGTFRVTGGQFAAVVRRASGGDSLLRHL